MTVGLMIEIVAVCELTPVAVDVAREVGMVIEDTVFFVLCIFWVIVKGNPILTVRLVEVEGIFVTVVLVIRVVEVVVSVAKGVTVE